MKQPPLDPHGIYLARDVIQRSGASKARVSSTLKRHNIGTLIGDRRQLTAEDVERACHLLANPAPAGNPNFGPGYTKPKPRNTRRKSG